MSRLIEWAACLILSSALVGPVQAFAAPSGHVAEVRPLLAADVARVIDEARGQPLLLEIWSLDCGYCRENAARIVAWQQAHHGVRVVMVAMDSFDDDSAALSQALERMPVTLRIVQYANAEAIPEKLRAALDPNWRGEMPRTLLIDAQGRRRASSGLLAPDALDAWLHAR